MTIKEGLTMRAPARGRGAGVRGAALPRWGAEPAPPPTDYPAPPDPQPPLYVYDEHINQRFAIWQGDITCLEVDALTNTTDESLSECNAVSERVMTGAGPELKEEIVTRGLECRPGEAVVTSGCRLRCRHVVHTACPAYSAQYHSAAETSLHNCYKNVLYAAADLNARTLALCPVDPPRRGFPPDLAAHTALRTIRCYLEQNPSPALVIMATNCGATCALLRALAPLYFPRSEGEARGGGGGGRGPRAPAPAPGPGGAGERRIRIIHNPHERAHQREDSAEDDTSLWSESAAVEAAALFARAADTQRLLPQPRDRDRDRDHAHPRHHPRRLRDDHDHQAIPKEVNECIDSELTMAMDTMAVELPDLSTLAPPAHQEETAEEKYERLLRRAKAEDLSEVSGIGCLYQSGVDRLGRPVVVFIGKWFPIGEIDLDKALLYLIKLLDPIVRGDYVIAYFHTLAASGNHPPFSWLKEVYTVLPYKYKKNLKAFYIVHPTFWTKMMTWWFTTFMAPAIKAKVHSLPGVEFLYSVLARDQLELPAFVTEYDMTINGLHYFQPDTSSS